MKVLVVGSSGQVATELKRFENVTALTRAQLDLRDTIACENTVANTDCDAIINAAAYTAVDKAESEFELVERVNAEAPAAMARAAARAGKPFIHISTDYVFDGSGDHAWREDSVTGPLGAYGRSKRAGECGVEAAGGRYLILRTSWVFSAHGSNFVKTMLRLGSERRELSVVGDQIGGPTAARDIAVACMSMARQQLEGSAQTGIYHFAGAPDTSWAEFARTIFTAAQLNVRVTDIPTTSYHTAARRPANSRLDCTRIARDFGIQRPDWKASLMAVLEEHKGS